MDATAASEGRNACTSTGEGLPTVYSSSTLLRLTCELPSLPSPSSRPNATRLPSSSATTVCAPPALMCVGGLCKPSTIVGTKRDCVSPCPSWPNPPCPHVRSAFGAAFRLTMAAECKPPRLTSVTASTSSGSLTASGTNPSSSSPSPSLPPDPLPHVSSVALSVCIAMWCRPDASLRLVAISATPSTAVGLGSSTVAPVPRTPVFLHFPQTKSAAGWLAIALARPAFPPGAHRPRYQRRHQPVTKGSRGSQ